LGNTISGPDIDGLKIFKLCEHPEIHPQIEVMKTQVMKYQALAASIKSFEEFARLSARLASSMQLTMTIRSRLTPTTFSYPCSHSLTNEQW
jgi:hypothetical protein